MAATQEQLEKQPLLAEEGKVGAEAEKDDEGQKLEEPDDSISYDARKLVTFEICRDFSGTVWAKASLWKMMGFLFALSILVSIMVAFCVRNPAELDVSKFQTISGFLRVVVGLLLGFFLSSSVARWYRCTNGFLELFDAIRGVHMQLNALGAPKKQVHLCIRYCILSASCLNNDLMAAGLNPKERAAYYKEKWQKMLTADKDSSVAWSHPTASLARVSEAELETLRDLNDPAQTLWVWVTSLLSRMAADGEIPPMPTPTYGRIIAIAEKAYSGIRMVREAVNVQPPYVYVQMMAMLVAVNNVLTATSFGMTMGVTVAAHVERLKKGKAFDAEGTAQDLQDLLITFILSTVGPFLYQALLEVAVCISQPFADAAKGAASPGHIPTEKLMYQLEKDLRDAETMTSNLPWWEQPHFKQPTS